MILTLAERAYGLIAGAYHRRWDKRGGWRAPVPVISVGNLTVGGNGKTPFVIELVKLLSDAYPHLAERNRIAVLSRGYGRLTKELSIAEIDSRWQDTGDEPLLIKRSCPHALVISFARRAESAKFAVEQFGAEVIVLDDGFQHRALARDVDLVLLDAHAPFDNGRLLPAGRLREPPTALSRATALIAVGHGDAVAGVAREFDKPLFRATPKPLAESWPERPSVAAFLLTGVARSERVRAFLEQTDIKIVGHRAYRDHHAFTAADLESVAREAESLMADAVLTTAKDMIRIPAWGGALPLVEIPYSLRFTDAKELLGLIDRSLGNRLIG